MTDDPKQNAIDPNIWTDELRAVRRRRSIILALVLGAMVVMFFLVTIVRLGANVANRTL